MKGENASLIHRHPKFQYRTHRESHFNIQKAKHKNMSKQDRKSFTDLIKCKECTQPMWKTKIYIIPNGESICGRCYYDPEMNAQFKCGCKVPCITRNRILEDVIEQCSKAPQGIQRQNPPEFYRQYSH